MLDLFRQGNIGQFCGTLCQRGLFQILVSSKKIYFNLMFWGELNCKYFCINFLDAAY